MSDSPIFDQLVSEFAAKGAVYEEFVKWSTPAFRWSGSDHIVQLDKQPRTGVNLTRPVAAPDLIAVDVKQMWSDYSLSLVAEGLHPTVKPLSERNSAEPME